MSDEQPAEGPEPRDGAFDDPAMAVGAQAATILVPPMAIVGPVGAGEDDAAAREAFPERVAVVGAVAEEMSGLAAVWGYPRGERGVDERDLRRGRRGDGDSQRNTLTLDQYHAL